MKAYYIEEKDIPLIVESLEAFKEYVKNHPESYFNVKQIEAFKEKYYAWIGDYINESDSMFQ